MDHKLHDFKELIRNGLESFYNISSDPHLFKNMHSVVVFWISPIEPFLCHRQGWFDEYVEAQMFGMKVLEEEKALGFETALYIDGCLIKYSVEELLETIKE